MSSFKASLVVTKDSASTSSGDKEFFLIQLCILLAWSNILKIQSHCTPWPLLIHANYLLQLLLGIIFLLYQTQHEFNWAILGFNQSYQHPEEIWGRGLKGAFCSLLEERPHMGKVLALNKEEWVTSAALRLQGTLESPRLWGIHSNMPILCFRVPGFSQQGAEFNITIWPWWNILPSWKFSKPVRSWVCSLAVLLSSCKR